MQVRWFEELEVFELELETVEGKRGELDEIVRRAGEWRFPAGGGGGGEMVLNQKKTKRSGWWGEKLRELFASIGHFLFWCICFEPDVC